MKENKRESENVLRTEFGMDLPLYPETIEWYRQVMEHDSALSQYEDLILKLEAQLLRINTEGARLIHVALRDARLLAEETKARRNDAIDAFLKATAKAAEMRQASQAKEQTQTQRDDFMRPSNDE